MSAKQLEEKQEIAASLYANLDRVSRHLRLVELPKGFTQERFRTLSTIYRHGPLSVTRLAELENLRPATVSRMLVSLQADGLIKRRHDKDDKRSIRISTTAKGRELFKRANQTYMNHIIEAIQALDPDEIELVSDLAKLLERLGSTLAR